MEGGVFTEFKNDIFTLDKSSSVTFELVEAKLPNSNDIFFVLSNMN